MGASFLGHTNAKKLQEEVGNAFKKDRVSLSKLKMLTSNDPNINKTFFNLLNDVCKSAGSSGLVDVGTCNIHKVHNAFGEALNAT